MHKGTANTVEYEQEEDAAIKGEEEVAKSIVACTTEPAAEALACGGQHQWPNQAFFTGTKWYKIGLKNAS
ncbi:hypothetical protein [Parasitella parasitica]|uniref:Uncharacterized protein n=1 Tax=Parasitella parasitica TaxID=35722 RepID=A0A0B7N4R7_9FUNG|nr:hypothetical protein [Parasitella parasitica]